MPILGLYLQHKDGTNLLLHTKSNWNAKIAYQVAQDVAVQVAQLRKEDFGPMGLRNIEPHFAQGRVTSLSFYQVAYELISDVYIAVVQHVDDNPFYSDATLQKAKQTIQAVCRSEKIGYEEVQKKHGELWMSLEKVLDNPRGDALDDWAAFEQKSLETRDALDTLFAIDFEIPSDLLPDAKLLHFGQAFGENANSSTPRNNLRAHSVSSAPAATSISASAKRKSASAVRGPEKPSDKKERKLKSSSTTNSTTAAIPERKATTRTNTKPSRVASTSPLKTKPIKLELASTSTPSTPPGSKKFTRSTSRESANMSDKATPLQSSTEDLPSSVVDLALPVPIQPVQPDKLTVDLPLPLPFPLESPKDDYRHDTLPSPTILTPTAIPSPSSDHSSTMPKTKLVIETVEEDDEVGPSGNSYEEDSDSFGDVHYDPYYYPTGLETPRLESPTDSEDSDNEDDLGSGIEPPALSRPLISRTDSSTIGSDLATTPRLDELEFH